MRDVAHRYTPYTFKEKVMVHIAYVLLIGCQILFSAVCALIAGLICIAGVCGIFILPIISLVKYIVTVYEAYTHGISFVHLLQTKYFSYTQHKTTDTYDTDIYQ